MPTDCDRLDRYRHPHLVALRMHPPAPLDRSGMFDLPGDPPKDPPPPDFVWRYVWRPFTGNEPEPALPPIALADPGLSEEDRGVLLEEYRIAKGLWRAARFTVAAAPLVKRARPAWEQYAAARQALRAAFDAALEDAGSGTGQQRWQAALHEAQQAALRAAIKWDAAAADLARLQEEYPTGRLGTCGAAGWELPYTTLTSDGPPSSTQEKIAELIAVQEADLRDLTGGEPPG